MNQSFIKITNALLDEDEEEEEDEEDEDDEDDEDEDEQKVVKFTAQSTLNSSLFCLSKMSNSEFVSLVATNSLFFFD